MVDGEGWERSERGVEEVGVVHTHPNVVCEEETYPSVACFGAILRSDRLDAIDRRRCLVATIARPLTPADVVETHGELVEVLRVLCSSMGMMG